jgi:hypothetical protein
VLAIEADQARRGRRDTATAHRPFRLSIWPLLRDRSRCQARQGPELGASPLGHALAGPRAGARAQASDRPYAGTHTTACSSCWSTRRVAASPRDSSRARSRRRPDGRMRARWARLRDLVRAAKRHGDPGGAGDGRGVSGRRGHDRGFGPGHDRSPRGERSWPRNARRTTPTRATPSPVAAVMSGMLSAADTAQCASSSASTAIGSD